MAVTAGKIAINADVGEGFGAWRIADDDSLLSLITCANVACGFHAGDPDILRRTCEVAVEHDVAIGAQVSYRDLAGFGRRYLAVPKASLVNDLLYQIGALDTFAKVAGGRVAYVKAHGALYNAVATDTDHAAAIVEAIHLYDATLPLFCQPETEVWRLAGKSGIRPLAEAFLDRAYTAEGLLVRRDETGAVITDPEIAARRAVRLVAEGELEAIDGTVLHIQPVSLCVHSDTPGAVHIVRAVVQALTAAGVELIRVG
jgi:5-oxoprolinase (ATP-hydrolysing) subunit A